MSASGRTASAPPVSLPARPAASQRLRRFALRGALTQVGCLVVGALYFLIGPGGRPFWTQWLYAACIGTCCWLFIDGGRQVLAALFSRRQTQRAEAVRGRHVSWLAVAIAIGTPAGYALGHRIAETLLGHGPRPLFHDLPALAVSLIAALAVSGWFLVSERLHEARTAAESARRIAAEHALKLLESQLEPHMLFNTLANLRVLIALDPPRAQAMLDRLIAFLRAMLGASRAGSHPLAAEFARIGDYLELMQVRMGERLRSTLRLPPDLAGLAVPPFLLQPLVENAVRHGLEPKVDGGRIEVSAAREGGRLVLCVRDTGAGLGPAADADDAHAGFGLTQVRERLTALYGASARLDLGPANDAEGGMLATVRLPLPPPARPDAP